MPHPFDIEPALALFASPDEEALVDSLSTDADQLLLADLIRRLAAWRAQLPRPTREQMLMTTHQENRLHVKSGNDTPEFWEGLEAEWRRSQKPSFAPFRSDLTWPQWAREWLETQRRAGRIFRDKEDAEKAIFDEQTRYEMAIGDGGVKESLVGRTDSEGGHKPAAPPKQELAAEFLSDYHHIRSIGEGYFATVTHYRQKSTGKDCAVKELKDEKYAYRFEREIRIMQALDGHPNIIRLIDHECADGRYRHISSKAETNLYKHVKRYNSSLTLEQRLIIFDQVLDAVGYAHSKNILHRDIAPTNVLVFEDEHIEVCDFGMGKDLTTLSNYTTSIVARYGQLYYVAPEQRDKLKDASSRSDIYSLGKLLNFILTGRDPDVIHPCDFNSVIEKATQYDPDARYETVSALQKAYNRIKLLLFTGNAAPTKTLLDFKKDMDVIDWEGFHQLAVRGEYGEHPYSDYVEPIITVLSHSTNLSEYYAKGDAFGDFINVFIARLQDLRSMTGWPFIETTTFARFLKDAFLLVQEPMIKLSCVKEIWNIAYEQDQWSAQSIMKGLLLSNDIPEEIQTRFAVYILDSSATRLPEHSSSKIPRILRQALINKAIELAK